MAPLSRKVIIIQVIYVVLSEKYFPRNSQWLVKYVKLIMARYLITRSRVARFFFDTIYQTGKIVTNDDKIFLIVTKSK
jgi:hypothetical protein